jgi:uncharacterized repeat protein (TIGR01451 family)
MVTSAVTKADLSAALSCPATLTVGGKGSCTLKVTNDGPATATGVVGEVSLPSNVAEAACTGCTRHGNVVTWKKSKLLPGDVASFGMTARAVRAGQATLTGVVDSTIPDPRPGNNFATATITIKS